jgi:hypothetical protein
MPRTVNFIKGALLLLALSACATLPRNPVPLDRQSLAVIPGLENARYWGDAAPGILADIIVEITAQRKAAGTDKAIVAIALSGGADDGAFGSGLLTAWSEHGDRPEFTTVTGVSTGALSAPFVFLGPEYDDKLRLMYGGFAPDKIFQLRSWVNILPNASAADSKPLADLIAQFVDDEMLAKIAAQHRRGRRLLVQTTHLDAQRAVIWDLGVIASSGSPNALEVFRKALLASASIPGAFPPVMFDVEVNGVPYDEMHVDGGVISEATVLSGWQSNIARFQKADAAKRVPATLYVVRNGRIAPEPALVEHSIFAIAGRAVSTLIKVQGLSDLMAGYRTAHERGGEYKVTWIGEDFVHDHPGPFDQAYMQALFDYGYDLMKSGKAWSDRPPQIMTSEEREIALRMVTQ